MPSFLRSVGGACHASLASSLTLYENASPLSLADTNAGQ